MADRREIGLSWEDLRAVGAATAPVDVAERDWREIVSTMAFDEIAEPTQRVMPTIFQNLRDVADLPERDRMRGAFKHHWSKTTELLHGVRPVLDELDARGVDYRVLKGAAIQAVTGSIGSRAMGDVDLLVSESTVDAVVEILDDLGFRRGTMSACSGHSMAEHVGAMDFNRGTCHIDVHVAEYKEPVRLLSMMMRAPARQVRAAGTVMRVPPAELLLLHAAVHGSLASGPTDFVQAVVDVSTLARLVDNRRLVTAARRTGTVLPLLEFDAAVRASTGKSLGIDVPVSLQAAAHAEAALTGVVDAATTTSSLTRRIRDRRRSRAAVEAVDRQFVGSRRAYGLWLRLGQFAVVERMAVQRGGGFLPRPSKPCASESVVRPFAEQDAAGITASTVADSALDWRFRIRLPEPQRWVRITLDSPTLDRFDTFLFCNGVPVRRIVAGDPTTRDLVLRDVGEDLEISLRALWTVCPRCFSDLDDLAVTIAFGHSATEVAA